MLAHAETNPVVHLPPSPRAGAKQGRAQLTVTLRPGQSHFPVRQGGAQPATNRPLFDFDGIFRDYQRSIYSKCFRIVRNQSDAEELVQEVFLQLLRKADTFRGEAKFSTWLHRLTINAALMQLRRMRRSELRTTSLEASPRSEGENAVGYKTANPWQVSKNVAADRISLDRAISQLPNGYRKVFSLHDVEGYTHAEITKLLGISAGASKSQLHRARLRLRVLLQDSSGQKTRSGCPPKRVIKSRKRGSGQSRPPGTLLRWEDHATAKPGP